jgi:acetyl/propionyl-CoA carboxylase alpha subunit/acetyl-CoA carboxylase carboxyltransferase component
LGLSGLGQEASMTGSEPRSAPCRIAIVNRGEPALRAIHAIAEMAHEHGRGLVSIALHTEAERAAMFVREADEAVRIGPGPGEASGGDPYLDLDGLEAALMAADADAVWVGWGFVAEHADFAERCQRLGVTFVGPSAAAMRRLGDKIEAKRLAQQAGVPVAPWSGGPVDDAEHAHRCAGEIGYPLVVKATAGGGGRGIRVVRRESELDDALAQARREAGQAFGDATVFMEAMVTGGHHIEVQIIADAHGGVWAAGVRECSTQRRNQKVLEESASPVLTREQERELGAGAAELARLAGYENAGTVEFLYDPDTRRFAFLEVNTRLQVEHPVTELVTGLDLVKLQLQVAAGGALEGEPPPAAGHAVEVRLNAEDAERGFAPAPGTIERLTLPAGPGVRVDTGVSQGDAIPPEYDSMIAKIIAWGASRAEALSRLGRALSQTTVLVRGGMTNRTFLAELVAHEDVLAGRVDTGWLDRLTANGGYAFDSRADVALVAAAIEAFDAQAEVERSRFYAAAARGRPQAAADIARTIELRHGGVAYRIDVSCTGPGQYALVTDGRRIVAEVERLRDFERRLTVGVRRFDIASITHGAERLVEVDGLPHRISQDEAGLVRAPGPGLLVALTVAAGDEVEAGATVGVLESMKMETVLSAPLTGRVSQVLASPNTQIDAGTPVLQLEATGDATAAPADPVDFTALSRADGPTAAEPVARCREVVAALGRLMLGYDLGADEAGELTGELERLCPDGDGELLEAETTVLQAFADISALSRNRRMGDEEDRQDGGAAQEYFHAFLRSVDIDAEGLPDSFRAKLQRALAHYGVVDLERTPELEEALYRIHLAQQRAGEQVPAVLALLDRRIRASEPPDNGQGEALRETLDHLIRATQVRHPAVGDLARRARHRCFDRPRLEREYAATRARVREHLGTLAAGVDAADHQQRISELVAVPQSLVGMLEDPAARGPALPAMLEVLTRRNYGAADLERVCAAHRGDHVAIVADGSDRRGRGCVIAIATDRDCLDQALVHAEALAGQRVGEAGDQVGEADGEAVADVYVTGGEHAGDTDAVAGQLNAALGALAPDSPLQRVTFSVTAAGPGEPEVRRLTFHRGTNGFVEHGHLRGIHPRVAGRLDLWRFEHFDLERLRSADEVYLFHGVARETSADERLFAMAEVRDLTPVRDADGRVTSLPELERVFAACIGDLRHALARFPAGRRPEWNRVVLHVWPPVDIPAGELDPVVRALAPMTEGLGIEQVMVRAQVVTPDGPRDVAARLYAAPGQGPMLRITDPPPEPLQPIDERTQKVLRARRRGAVYPYELIPQLLQHPRADPAETPSGVFVEHDLDANGQLVPVDRPEGANTASVVVGTLTTPTARYPEGMTRVGLLGDPTKGLGSLTEAECARIVAALDLAERRGVPVEWFAVSAGARIAMDSGTENMDWVARVLRRIVTFTQAGGEINVVVTGINVGAQPYWNAEATMLMHTKGILVMTPASAMVLTGKQALDYSGGVSADDNFGIGGYDRVMGPNGQAQYWASDLTGAVEVLFAHYDHAYVAPGERFPRPAATTDPRERDVSDFPCDVDGGGIARVGDIFDDAVNPERKQPFDVRTLMRAVSDQDHQPLERWPDMAGAETAVVFDARLGGQAVTLLGFESRPLPRRGLLPADGPDQWTAGTLFPRASKKTARAINAASHNRPVVALANLSGFDGSPESLRELQLEYGAEIGRAVVNFDGPIVFCVVSRYHGGAFVVFSTALNDDLEVTAVEGARASVIGGAAAAGVVFGREVRARTERDPRVSDLEERRAKADEAEAARLQAELDETRPAVRAEQLGEVAAQFDAIHTIERAAEVGSVDAIIPPARLRPYLVEAVERGVARVGARR